MGEFLRIALPDLEGLLHRPGDRLSVTDRGVDGFDVPLGDRLDLEDGADRQLRGGPEVTGLARVLAGHREDDVAPLDDHRGPGHAEPVDAIADDVLGQAEVLLVRLPDGDQGDPRAALQVDTELGCEAPLGHGERGEEEDEKHQGEDGQQCPGPGAGIYASRTDW